jgi:7-carboxy-7-deazaguanine synthase
MRDDTVVIHEIYRSIQGESSFAGQLCTFVRTTGCNLRCSWCDTKQAFYGGTKRARTDVLAEALSLGTQLVELTGGEPLLQPAVPTLLRELCDAGRTVLLETSGERDIAVVDPRVHRIVDFKAPGSGMVLRNRWENVQLLTSRDEVKLVVADRGDYLWAREVVRGHDLRKRVARVLLSPVHGVLAPQALVAWVLEDELDVSVNLQLHKYIWGLTKQGV